MELFTNRSVFLDQILFNVMSDKFIKLNPLCLRPSQASFFMIFFIKKIQINIRMLIKYDKDTNECERHHFCIRSIGCQLVLQHTL